MKFNKDWLEKRWVSYTVATCSAVVLYLGLSNISLLGKAFSAIWNYIHPIFLGLIFAYIMNPLMKFYQRKLFRKVKNNILQRNLAILLTFISVLLFVALLLVLLVPQIIENIVGIFNNAEAYGAALQYAAEEVSVFFAKFGIDLSSVITNQDFSLSAWMGSISQSTTTVINTSGNIGRSIFNVLIALITAYYFLEDKKRMQESAQSLLRAILPEKSFRDVSDFWGRCNKILIHFIGYDMLDALIVGVLNAIFLLIVRAPNVALISVICGVTNLAPIFGPVVGGVLGAFILVLNKPWYALAFIIFTIVLQTVDGYVIKPKLFGNTLGVPSIWILISLVVGGRMFGVWGVLLAIPFAAIFDFVYKDMIYKALEKRKEERRSRRAKKEKEAAEEPQKET
jgi:predicted PurR-regulated permease PerM